MSLVPVALAGVFGDYVAAESRVRALFRNRTETELNWHPTEKNWSILQCVDHLTVAAALFYEPMEKAVAETPETGPESYSVIPGILWGSFMAMVEPRMLSMKAPAPKSMQPREALNAEQTFEGFRQSHARLRAIAAQCMGRNVNRVTFRHPAIPMNISIGNAFLLHAAHERRHLVQAEKVSAQLPKHAPAARDAASEVRVVACH